MLLLYIVMSFVMLLISLHLFKRYINPMSIYTIIWLLCVVLHEMPFAGYYSLSVKTYCILFLAQIAFLFGCLFSSIIKVKKISVGFSLREDSEKKNIFEKTLSVLSVMAGISIWTNFTRIMISTRGHVLANIGQMYKIDVYKESTSSLSLATMIFPLALLVGVYICKYGFSKFLLVPTLDIVFLALSSGSRGSIIIIMALLVAPFTCVTRVEGIVSDNDLSLRKQKKGIIAITTVLILAVFASTYSRDVANGVDSTPVVSVLRFLSGYLSAGVACLNEYLKAPTIVGYPQFFFRVPFILLNKLNITHVDTFFWIETYYTPEPSNVITYIGELYHDFGENFFWVIFIMAFIWGVSYKKTVREKSLSWLIVYACFFVLFGLSFFSNFGHISALWMVMFVGIPCSWIIDYKIFRLG